MKKLIPFVLTLCIAFLFYNCTDDDFNATTISNPQTEADILKDQEFKAENFGAPTTGDFIGLVKDVDGNNILGAQITIGNSVTTTDRNGMFILNNADVFENFAYVKVQKEGYIKGSRVVTPKTSGENRIDIVLFKKNVTETVTSGDASTVALENGAKVNFSGGFVRPDGSEYNGQVEVVLHYIEPNSINTFTQMPGSLLAQTEANDAQNLETYGMLSVNLFSPSGELLNIDENNPATIEFPVHYSQSSIAPETINLWYFDETQGYWKEDGQAVKDGDKYISEVTHFTWWNCDVPFDAIEFCFNLIPNNTAQNVPYYVIIKRLSNDQFIYSGIVTSGEYECGLIPRNEEVNVSIYQFANQCFGQLVTSQTLGGYATDTSVDISFDESIDLLTTNITGIASDCSGNPITNGYLYVDEYNTFSITNGIINIGLQHCEIQSVTVQIFDFDSNQWAIIDNVPLNAEDYNLGTVSSCEGFGGFFNGNLKLSTQQEINDFGAFGFISILGNVTIGDNVNYTDITDLSPLTSITTISDNLTIIGNENLQGLQGITNITDVGGSLYIKENLSLNSLQGFNNSVNIGTSVTISENSSLTSLQGIETFNLTSQNDLTISDNNALTSLLGLESLTTIRFLNIRHNDVLASLAQLENLTTVLEILIDDNDSLIDLQGLESLTEARSLLVANNETLQSLDGIENLIITGSTFSLVNIGVLQWEGECSGYTDGPNPNLNDLCALTSILTNSNWNNNFCVVILGNAYNPSAQDILNGNCTQ